MQRSLAFEQKVQYLLGNHAKIMAPIPCGSLRQFLALFMHIAHIAHKYIRERTVKMVKKSYRKESLSLLSIVSSIQLEEDNAWLYNSNELYR
jgi:hypothetical protein